MNYSPNDINATPTVEDTIEALRQKGVLLWIENGALRYRARKGVVTASDIANLRSSEAAIYSLLSGLNSATKFEPHLLARHNKTRAPLAFSQLVHWTARESLQRRPIRQIASATLLQGPLDVEAIKDAVSEVIRRHEALRTRIIVLDGIPLQEIVGHNVRNLELIELTENDPQEQQAQVQSHIDSAILYATDYATDPLFRALLIRLDNRNHIMVLALEHIVSDGASLVILRSEILEIYAQLGNKSAICLPPVQMHCIDYAIWQRTQLAGSIRKHAVAHRNFCLTRFPTDVQLMDQHGWGTVRFVIGASRKSALQLLARRHGTSLTMMVLNVYVGLVLRWCGTFESVIQIMVDGRTSRLVERSIAYLAFPLYLHVMADGCETPVDLLKIVTREYCAAHQRPDFFYSYVQRPIAAFTRNTCFNWLPRREVIGREPLTIRGEALTCAPVAFENPILREANCDAEPTVMFEDTGESIVGEVNFQKARFSEAIMRRFVNNFAVFAQSFVETPMGSIWDIPMS